MQNISVGQKPAKLHSVKIDIKRFPKLQLLTDLYKSTVQIKSIFFSFYK